MTQEEKAKAYDNVREKIAIRFGSNVADEIFSQFEMSEDERIRRRIIHALHGDVLEMNEIKEAVSWLENQSEQKPAEWSKEDDIYIENIILSVKKQYPIAAKELVDWLESLKDRCLPQPKVEWSEEDKETIDLTIAILKENLPNGYFKTNPINTLNMGGIHTDELIEKLKSLRPSYYCDNCKLKKSIQGWKPSEEQIMYLSEAIDIVEKAEKFSVVSALKELKERLKAL